VIIVTGLGRSGTSFLALVYRELGFDPGGEWYDDMNAGMEAKPVVDLNSRIIRELGIGYPLRDLPEWVKRGRERLPGPVRRAVQARYEVVPEIRARRPAVRWERFPAVVARLGPRLVEEAAARPVVKDPRFMWTLGVWAAAGAAIEHVLVCLRNIDAVIGSRVRIGGLSADSWNASKNALLLAAGTCLMALHEHDLAHDYVRFPSFLEAPRDLFEAMRFPGPVAWDAFSVAFDRVTDRNRVHDWR
jgi:hypothetical protein